MKQIVEVLMSPETGSLEDEQRRICALEDLDDIVSGLDRAKDFCIIGGMSALV